MWPNPELIEHYLMMSCILNNFPKKNANSNYVPRSFAAGEF